MNSFSTLPTASKTNPKSAANWAHQTLGLFPPTQKVTQEFLATLVSLFCEYSEKTLAAALEPKKLIAQFQYLPDLHTFKKLLDDVVATPAEQDARRARLKEQLAEREKYTPKSSRKADYTGPIEEVRPGDILTFERMEEYKAFMAKKNGMKNLKVWGANEDYKDSGARPFAAAYDPVNAPGHDDLMVTPESLDAWLEENPLPEENK